MFVVVMRSAPSGLPLSLLHGPMFGADVAGAKRLIPEAWRRHKEFDNIHKLDGVAVITVQLRYNGWITEMQDSEKARTTSQVGLACSLSHVFHCRSYVLSRLILSRLIYTSILCWLQA